MGFEAGIKKSACGITNHLVRMAGLNIPEDFSILSHPLEIARNQLFDGQIEVARFLAT